MSIISAVTLKRKKCLSTHLQGSSADEDSEHEPVKASNNRVEEGRKGEEKEEEDRGNEEKVKGESMITKKEKKDEKEKGMKVRETTDGKDSLAGGSETEKDVRTGKGSCTKKVERESQQKTTLFGNAPQLCPNISHCSHHQICAAYPRPPTMTNNPPDIRPHTLTTGRPIVPLWISPTRLPNLYQSSSFHGTPQAQWNKSASVRSRKTKSGRTRALSMNLDLELERSEDRVRRWRAERVEVIRVIEGTPGQHGCVGISHQSVVLPGSIQQTGPISQIDQSSTESSTVVLRRLTVDTRDKTKAWRRHTVIV